MLTNWTNNVNTLAIWNIGNTTKQFLSIWKTLFVRFCHVKWLSHFKDIFAWSYEYINYLEIYTETEHIGDCIYGISRGSFLFLSNMTTHIMLDNLCWIENELSVYPVQQAVHFKTWSWNDGWLRQNEKNTRPGKGTLK